ncbi:MAG TPA: hypothetical protein VH496_00750 [Mycobacterium sp.]|jgi:hypothetical protein
MTTPYPTHAEPVEPAQAGMSARGWMAFGVAAAAVSAAVIGLVVTYGSPSGPKTITVAPPHSLPDLGGPHSQLVPEMTLPAGATPYVGKHPTPPGFEFWEVPGSRHELVAKMRSELPTYKPLNGMPWCGELNDALTSWAWGTAADTIGVSLTDGGVMIRRFPDPHGCRP